MKIRPASRADLEAIYAIELDNFSPEEAMAKEVLGTHIDTIKTSFLVAEKDGKILGYLEGPVTASRHLEDRSFTSRLQDDPHLVGGYISITSLSIAREAQGMKLGQKLLAAMKELATEDQRQGINLTCHDYLIGYYEKQGFVNEGLSQSTYANQVWYDLVWDNPDYHS
ncbi:GNAT family N-acetyltransferase [Streptococcus oricebi]|uniref:GNAT family N-acetyltransferase n=1 Tax=Streptococcus oricebi TaxID=1547447 RepID=A0ABS5B3L5_9STRE|nr:N-acetyltransferase [Streptococcus oricebi]MBP2623424.1 GNAT family N-acetyltransferase [Streptococcus oricebi]